MPHLLITKINNKEIDDAKYIDIIMRIYNLIEYSDNYSKPSRSLWQYYRDEPFLDNNNGAITDFPADNNNIALFNFKTKIAGRTGTNGTKNIGISVPLKY